jgi:hypothetical protein
MVVTRSPVSNQMPRREMFALWDHDEGLIGNGTNHEVVGPRVLLTAMHLVGFTDAAGAASIPYYYYHDLFTANTTNNRDDIVWAEQMPF